MASFTSSRTSVAVMDSVTGYLQVVNFLVRQGLMHSLKKPNSLSNLPFYLLHLSNLVFSCYLAIIMGVLTNFGE